MLRYDKFNDSIWSNWYSSANWLPSRFKIAIFEWNAKGLISFILLNEQSNSTKLGILSIPKDIYLFYQINQLNLTF